MGNRGKRRKFAGSEADWEACDGNGMYHFKRRDDGKGEFLEDEEQDERGFWTRGKENCEEGAEGRAAVHAGEAVHHAVHAQEAVR